MIVLILVAVIISFALTAVIRKIAVKKNHFDILVSSKKEAVEWGVREIPARICATKKK